MCFEAARSLGTLPGANQHDPFSPPAGWTGAEEDYRDFIASRLSDPVWSSRMGLYTMVACTNSISATGPYAQHAAEFMSELVASRGFVAQVAVCH